MKILKNLRIVFLISMSVFGLILTAAALQSKNRSQTNMPVPSTTSSLTMNDLPERTREILNQKQSYEIVEFIIFCPINESLDYNHELMRRFMDNRGLIVGAERYYIYIGEFSINEIEELIPNFIKGTIILPTESKVNLHYADPEVSIILSAFLNNTEVANIKTDFIVPAVTRPISPDSRIEESTINVIASTFREAGFEVKSLGDSPAIVSVSGHQAEKFISITNDLYSKDLIGMPIEANNLHVGW